MLPIAPCRNRPVILRPAIGDPANLMRAGTHNSFCSFRKTRTHRRLAFSIGECKSEYCIFYNIEVHLKSSVELIENSNPPPG
jgi:hypothetical protein